MRCVNLESLRQAIRASSREAASNRRSLVSVLEPPESLVIPARLARRSDRCVRIPAAFLTLVYPFHHEP